MTEPEIDVLIVGAGPVGLTLALDLASRGIAVTLVERHAANMPPIMRCNHISSRSMELFRYLGLAAEIRQAGLPGWFPHDIAFMTSVTGYEFGRIRIPCRDDRFKDGDYADAGWPTAEPPHRCNQMHFEPILCERVLNTPNITVFFDTEISDVTQDDAGATAMGDNRQTGERVRFHAKYIVGCDGGTSRIRGLIGAEFQGDAVISKSRSVRIRAPDILRLRTTVPSWMTWVINPQTHGLCNVMAINGSDLWSFSYTVPAKSEGFEDFDNFDMDTALFTAVGQPFDYEVLKVDDWYGRRLVSNKFRNGRIFICGDAAHIWAPFAGYGMNAGLADAAVLAWQLAGVLNGWGGQTLLDAYEVERRPVTGQVSRHVAELARGNLNASYLKEKSAELARATPEGEALRTSVGARLVAMNTDQFACRGLNYGTHYDASPIICYDGATPPFANLGTYTPSTVPGCRAPHLWLRDGVSLYDQAGGDFMLICSDPTVNVDGLAAAAADRQVPLKLINVYGLKDSEVYDHALVLARPDQHIAWRANSAPDNPHAILDIVLGHRRMDTTGLNEEQSARNRRGKLPC